ncbi:tetratricopeptide repeat protein 1-like [Elysia marginata]|uniref:Tetratricopeptide repeat protein 1 n=1 Tax=Elysia marginata TaxID=1093978 RepID=A0AAV4EGA1_9GAST|nr:tetratricopeptide repeat protein 1-like [Elysia marginata]
MESQTKEEDKNSSSENHALYSHNPDEFIDIHGTHTALQASSSLKAENLLSNGSENSKVSQETANSFVLSSSAQSSTHSLKLPVQETEGTVGTGGTVVHHDSDEEYQSAEDGEGEYNTDDDDEDDFIPTTEMLTLDDKSETKETNSAEADASGDSCDADESESEETSARVDVTLPEDTEVEVDPLEARKELEKSLTPEEKQERKDKSQNLKDEGNTKFRNAEYEEAITSYSSALDLCPLDFHKERSIMYANRAACKMKQECFEDAIADSSSALELHPHYLKAMLRRAELYEKTDKLDEALKDYQKVVELDPSQHAARAACLKLAEQIKDRNEKMKEEMMGKLKDLGNMVLRPFGLSVNNFNLQQDPNTGSYSVQFQQSPPGNGNGS